MAAYCILCKKRVEKGQTTFAVPTDPTTKRKWEEICGKNFARKTRICVYHFSRKSMIELGNKMYLLPNAEPFVKQADEAILNNSGVFNPQISNAEEHTNDSDCSIIPPSKTYCVANEYEPQSPQTEETSENTTFENSKEIFTSNLLNVMPSQLQEEPIMEMPITKSVCCTQSSQTNTRLCGLVQASGYSDDFRFICFYCSQVFPLEKWKFFVNHLKENHIEIEALKMFEYVSDDHDYTPINLSSSTPAEDDIIKDEPPSILEDPLEPTLNSFDSVVFHPTADYVQNENNIITSSSNNLFLTENLTFATPNVAISHDVKYAKKEPKYCSFKEYRTKNKSKQITNKTALSRCLKRTNTIDVIDPEEREEFIENASNNVHQKPTEITFQYTPRAIVDLLLDSMKNYPVLWQYDYGPFNECFYEAVENLCKIINEKWSLNIDNLTMRRSINRMIRFYCCLFPNTNVENVDEFTCYYDKLAEFLPSSVHEIAYARCSHCYMCFRSDFDLKRHLSNEYKYLQWLYKCTICEECFRDSDEFEFHNLLPHYDEIYTCRPCDKRYDCYFTYKKHMSKYHPKTPCLPGSFKCKSCPETFDSAGKLRTHKFYHGERKFKCNLCPKSYYENSGLKLHLKWHRKELDFICEVCGKAFLVPSNLRVHMKMHTGAKVNCSICNMRLRKSSLSRHLRLTHVPLEGTIEELFRKGKERKNDFKKNVWPKSALRKQERRRRKYFCNICKTSFEKHKLILKHNNIFHSDNWACKICSSEYSGKRNLKQHYRRFHKFNFTQIFRLVEENEDFNTVLDMKTENIDQLPNKVVSTSRNKSKTKSKSPIKSDLLPDEMYFETENVHGSTIQDEIIKIDDDNVVSQEIRMEFMSDLFTEFLIEEQES